MKRLTVMFVAVAVSGLSHAATCSWASGALKTALNKDGGWGSTTVNTANALVTMNIYYLADETAYNNLASKTMQELYDSYKGETANLTGQNKNATSGKLIGAITINDSNAYAGAQYAVAIATYTDATYGDMYIATRVATGYSPATSKGTATSIISNVSSGWAPVPEPTSAMLLMLGLCGLALKRKNA